MIRMAEVERTGPSERGLRLQNSFWVSSPPSFSSNSSKQPTHSCQVAKVPTCCNTDNPIQPPAPQPFQQLYVEIPVSFFFPPQ